MVHEVVHVIGNNNLKTGKDTKGVYEVSKFGIVPELRQILFLYKTSIKSVSTRIVAKHAKRDRVSGKCRCPRQTMKSARRLSDWI